MSRTLLVIPMLFLAILFMFEQLLHYLSRNSSQVQMIPVISSIDSYQRVNHVLPSALYEIADYSVGYMASNPVYYDKCNDDHYLVTIIVNSTRDMTYDSKDKRWHNTNVTCQR